MQAWRAIMPRCARCGSPTVRTRSTIALLRGLNFESMQTLPRRTKLTAFGPQFPQAEELARQAPRSGRRDVHRASWFSERCDADPDTARTRLLTVRVRCYSGVGGEP